jgi:hypothetical protein
VWRFYCKWWSRNDADAVAVTDSSGYVAPASPMTCAIDPLPGLCVGRPATSQEEAAMIAVGKPAAERDLHAVDASTCSGNQTCFKVGTRSRAMVGTNAGTFYAQVGGASGGGGAACFVFLYEHLHDRGWVAHENPT